MIVVALALIGATSAFAYQNGDERLLQPPSRIPSPPMRYVGVGNQVPMQERPSAARTTVETSSLRSFCLEQFVPWVPCKPRCCRTRLVLWRGCAPSYCS